MSAIFVRFSNSLKAIYWRAFMMGAKTPDDEIWKIYLAGLSCLILSTLPIIDSFLASTEEIETWRVYMGWGMIGFCVFIGLPLVIVIIYGHYHRDQIDPEILSHYDVEAFDLGRSMKIGMAAAITAPPLFRYILSLFGWEPSH